MHRILLSVLCSGLLAPACSHRDTEARASHHGAHSAQHDDATADLQPLVARFVDKLRVELDLSNAQTAEMQEIFADHAARLNPHLAYIGEQTTQLGKYTAFKERESQIAAIRQDTDTRVQSTLNDTQYAEYLRLQDDLRKQIRDRVRES